MTVAVSDIRALDEQLDAQIEAANTAVQACPALAASDATAWAGFYAAWKAKHTQWSSVSASLLGGLNVGGVLVTEYFSTDLYNQMLNFQKPDQLPAWQAKIHAACPSYGIPPAIQVKPPPSNEAAETWDKIVKGLITVAEIGAGVTAAVLAFKIYRAVK